MSIDPQIWGHSVWTMMYSVAAGCDDEEISSEQRVHLKAFYESLQFVLPCETCKKHYQELYTVNPVENHLENKRSLMTWIVEIQNQINKNIQPNLPQLTIEIVQAIYLQKDHSLFLNLGQPPTYPNNQRAVNQRKNVNQRSVNQRSVNQRKNVNIRTKRVQLQHQSVKANEAKSTATTNLQQTLNKVKQATINSINQRKNLPSNVTRNTAAKRNLSSVNYQKSSKQPCKGCGGGRKQKVI